MFLLISLPCSRRVRIQDAQVVQQGRLGSAPASAPSPARCSSSTLRCAESCWHQRISASAHVGDARWRHRVSHSPCCPGEWKNGPAQAGQTFLFQVVSVMLVWVWRWSAAAGYGRGGQGQSMGKRCSETGFAVRAVGKWLSTCR